MDKIRVLAAENKRSVNMQISFAVEKYLEAYEKEHKKNAKLAKSALLKRRAPLMRQSLQKTKLQSTIRNATSADAAMRNAPSELLRL